MKKIVMLMALVMTMVACEEKEISLYPSFEESATFNINTESGSFLENAIIYSSDINKAVNDVKDDGGILDRIVIEGIWFEITPKSANTAQSMEVSFQIRSWDTDKLLPILKDFSFDIKAGKVNFIKHLSAEGITELKRQLNAIAKGLPSDDIEFVTEGGVLPDGSRVDVDVEVFVNATVILSTTVGI